MEAKTTLIGAAVIFGALAIGAAYKCGSDKIDDRAAEKEEERKEKRRSSASYPDPCEQFPDEAVCRKAQEVDDPTTPPPRNCFYEVGSPCDEGLTSIVVPSDCNPDKGAAVVGFIQELPKVEGFTPDGTRMDPEKFDIKAFQTLVGLIARQSGEELPPSVPLPHELTEDERAGLAAGIAMVNRLSEDVEPFLRERAKRIEQECAGISPSTEGSLMPLRCAPFEVERCRSRNAVIYAIADSSAPRTARCEDMLKLFRLNGMKVKPRELAECRVTESPTSDKADAGADADTDGGKKPVLHFRPPKPPSSR